MEEFKNLKEIIELCRVELYRGDRNIHATLGFEELKELQCLLDNYDVHKRSNEILLTEKRYLEKECEEFRHSRGIISEICVDESKCHITSKEAIEEIRKNIFWKAKGE